FSIAARFRKQNEVYIPVLVRGAALGNGDGDSRFVLALQDLSHQEAVTNALQSARDSLALALVSTGLGTFDLSIFERDLGLSPQAARMLALDATTQSLRAVL